MHLLVLSAFRPEGRARWLNGLSGLNAPSGAQCFPTPGGIDVYQQSSGSQCTFWCSVLSDPARSHGCAGLSVSMHLLVLSAFRLRRGPGSRGGCVRSQCTFWCSVLSDSAPRKPCHNAVYRNEIAADLESTTSNRPAPVQLNHTTAKNRHKPPQRRRCPLPASTPPTFNEPKPKNRPLTTTPELTSSYWASRIPCCKVMTILPAEKPIQVYTEIKITRKHQIENQQHRIGDWVLLCVNDAETHTRLIKG